jgi:hypothetical protein
VNVDGGDVLNSKPCHEFTRPMDRKGVNAFLTSNSA